MPFAYRRFLDKSYYCSWLIVAFYLVDGFSTNAKVLVRKFPEDKGYSVRNLRYMRRFAENYPDFPILQVPLAELAQGKDYVDVPLTTISWYHHISLLPKIKSDAERAFYILETTRNGWSRICLFPQSRTPVCPCCKNQRHYRKHNQRFFNLSLRKTNYALWRRR
ncbi:MAG: hypothetical protein K2L22_05000 [Muribaculaceae bacterium]|nr:hypothetical protein [Muribaculaceae bacterium]